MKLKLTPEMEAILKRAGKTIEDLEKDIDNLPTNPINKDVVNSLGDAVVVTFQNDNQLGDLVMSLFLQVNDLAMVIMQLQSDLEEIKNA
jgi:hypothetical protein